MIKLSGVSGNSYYLSPDSIVLVTEANESSQAHGIGCFIKTFDGRTIEVRELAQDVVAMIDKNVQ